jgi:hypothetical protein
MTRNGTGVAVGGLGFGVLVGLGGTAVGVTVIAVAVVADVVAEVAVGVASTRSPAPPLQASMMKALVSRSRAAALAP